MTSETSFNENDTATYSHLNRVAQLPSRLNKSGVMPCGRAVLVEPYKPEVAKSIIVMPDTVKERQSMVETRAVVIDVGPAAWDDEPGPRAIPGDKVILTRYAGHMVHGTADGKLYRLVNDRDIFCRIEVEVNE